MNKSYPAKLLLFGEYTVLLGGQALAIPYYQYRGQWINPGRASSQDHSFDLLIEYLEEIRDQLYAKVDLSTFKSFIRKGGVFKSDVPQGVGLGSSATLTASLYDLLSDHKALDLIQKKSDLGLIESFYHGQSSGFDALVSLMQRPILIESQEVLVILDELPQHSTNLYLLITEEGRKTQNLVSWFKDSCRDTIFQKTMSELVEANNMAIQYFIKGRPVLDLIKKISAIQFYHLQQLISPAIKGVWEKTMSDENLSLKLLGAGGGGYYLLFSRFEIADDHLDGFQLKKINLSA